MKGIFVQVYEIQHPSEAEQVIALGVDHIGSVILSEQSWKNSDIRDVIRTSDRLGVKSSLIPLFSKLELVLKVLDYYEPHLIHFCESLVNPKGDLRFLNQYIQLQEHVKNLFPDIKIIRSIPIGQPGISEKIPSLDLAALFEPVSDYFLTDTLLIKSSGTGPASQPVSGFVGITGKTCDWDIAKKLVESSQIPVILAGGITPDNVIDGIRSVMPAGVDSCTGTNTVDANGRPIRFKKDLNKVKMLVQNVRKAEQELGFPSTAYDSR